MAGPLRPQWVMSRGPSVRSLVPGSEASTCSTETPEMSASRGSLMLNVKSEGTGVTMVWPKDSAIARPPEALLPPVAMISRSQSRGSTRAQRQLQAERGPFDGADGGLDADVDAGAPGGGRAGSPRSSRSRR